MSSSSYYRKTPDGPWGYSNPPEVRFFADEPDDSWEAVYITPKYPPVPSNPPAEWETDAEKEALARWVAEGGFGNGGF